MPLTITTPGVYLQEVPSSAHAVVPVVTGIAAFLGRAPMGPTDAPVTIFSFGDYSRIFGGIASDYPMSFAIEDFFVNGGSQAIICRLFEPGGDDGHARLRFGADPSALTLLAANPGTWGNRLTASVDVRDITDRTLPGHGTTVGDLFNLTLELRDEGGTLTASERFLNVSVKPDGGADPYPGRLDRVLADRSSLARVAALSDQPPADGALAAGTGGDDGTDLTAGTYLGDPARKTGLHVLDQVDVFDLMCVPPDRRMLPDVPAASQDLPAVVRQAVTRYCADRRAFFIVDPPVAWSEKRAKGLQAEIDIADLGLSAATNAGPDVFRNAAVYFPRIRRPDPLTESQPALFPPCGIVAGIMAATDRSRGVWKAPAGMDAGLSGISALEFDLDDAENGLLNPLGINCLRNFAVAGPVVWGARTLRGADVFADDYKYVPVRRLTLFIESSLVSSTRWAVFERNDETLWSALRLEVGAFLADLARQGAFYDYSVACDAATTTPADVALGRVVMLVRIAPVRPGEFLTIRIEQATISAVT